MVQACGGVSTPERRPPATAEQPPRSQSTTTTERPQLVFFDPEDYAGATVDGWAGSRACAECHETEFAHWQRTPHARAWAQAENAVDDPPLRCRRCHASLLVSPETDAERLDLDLAGVGCESCHGPAKAHAEDPESPTGRISGVRDGCPECNFRSVCQVCHNTEGDPDFRYFAAYKQVTHPDPDDGGDGEEIPLTGAGGPACRRQATR